MTARRFYASGEAAPRFARSASTASRSACSMARRRRLGGEDVVCRHHQGLHRARRRHDAGGDARRHGRDAARRARGKPAGRCSAGSPGRCRRCTPRRIAGSPRWRRSRASSATIRRRARSSKAPRGSTSGSPRTIAGDKRETEALTAFVKGGSRSVYLLLLHLAHRRLRREAAAPAREGVCAALLPFACDARGARIRPRPSSQSPSE